MSDTLGLHSSGIYQNNLIHFGSQYMLMHFGSCAVMRYYLVVMQSTSQINAHEDADFCVHLEFHKCTYKSIK